MHPVARSRKRAHVATRSMAASHPLLPGTSGVGESQKVPLSSISSRSVRYRIALNSPPARPSARPTPTRAKPGSRASRSVSMCASASCTPTASGAWNRMREATQSLRCGHALGPSLARSRRRLKLMMRSAATRASRPDSPAARPVVGVRQDARGRTPSATPITRRRGRGIRRCFLSLLFGVIAICEIEIMPGRG